MCAKHIRVLYSSAHDKKMREKANGTRATQVPFEIQNAKNVG